MEMEPINPCLRRLKFPKPSSGGDSAPDDGTKFSDLPEPVIHHIFSFLETIDVIRASSVSRSWRYFWTSMPHLRFNHESFKYRRIYEEFNDFVNWVLMAHDKSVSIRSFRLSCLKNDNDHSVYRWVNILTQKHVQELHFDVASDSKQPFVLLRCLFSSDMLEVLELNLRESALKIPTHAGFSRLKSLNLVDTHLWDQNLFQNFISNCPLLEILNLDGCSFHDFKVLDISLRNLKKLVIDSDVFGVPFDDGLGKCELRIACPNLAYFDLTGSLVQSLSWVETPSFLQTAIIFAFCYEPSLVNEEYAEFVLKILKGYISPAVARKGCLPPMFYSLKSLRVSTLGEECYLQSIINLLKCAPNLQLLSIHIDLDQFSDIVNSWMIPDEDIACLGCHLKMVKLIDFDTNDNELEPIGFLLKKGFVSEKIRIIWHSGIDEEAERKAIEKVMKFPRSSSCVNVIFSKPKHIWGGDEL